MKLIVNTLVIKDIHIQKNRIQRYNAFTAMCMIIFKLLISFSKFDIVVNNYYDSLYKRIKHIYQPAYI